MNCGDQLVKGTHRNNKKSLKLERIRDFLETINNPQNTLQCIHIAGTKGKGSTCAFIAYILRQAGYKVGLYTSPHLSDFRERIRILNAKTENPLDFARGRREPRTGFEGMISKKELVSLVEKLKPAIEKYNKKSKYGPLSFFEVYTALAFVYFKEKKADFAVLETGLGGRLDATNVVNPLVSVITPISYEHTQKLGKTLRKIALEKAGIIKGRQSIVITAPQGKEAVEVIRNRCKALAVKLYEVGKDILYEQTKAGFKVRGLLGDYPDLRLKLLGRHQLINAGVAIGAVEALRFGGINIDTGSIRRGLYNTVWPGRCEVISRKPFIVLDGAQNAASAKALKETIIENFSTQGEKYKRLILVLGISNDKNIKGICKEIFPLADTIILTQADNPRAAGVDSIERIIGLGAVGCRPQVIKTRNVKEAMIKAKNIATKEDLILVTGSLFVVGEARVRIKPSQAR